MSLESFLKDSGFIHIKERPEIFESPMIYIFSESLAVTVQRVLSLSEPPHFSLIRESKLGMNGTMLAPLCSKPMNYTHYMFTPQNQHKFTIVSGTKQGISGGNQKIIRKDSEKDFLVVAGGVWIHRKYLLTRYEEIIKDYL